MIDREQVFAVVRIDQDEAAASALSQIVTITGIFPTSEEAAAEAQRLNQLQAPKGVKYFWQATRLYPHGRPPRPRPLGQAIARTAPREPILGIDLPHDFPAIPYESVASHVRNKALDPGSLADFWGAWAGLAYRFSACAHHDEAFTQSVQTAGASPPFGDRQHQERHLFEFFITGLSALDCFGAALSALDRLAGGLSSRRSDAAVDRRLPTLSELAKHFRRRWPSEPVGAALTSLLSDASYLDFRGARNLLTHRAHPGRTFLVGGPDHGQAQWTGLAMSIDENTTRARRQWLAQTLEGLLEGTRVFVQAHL